MCLLKVLLLVSWEEIIQDEIDMLNCGTFSQVTKIQNAHHVNTSFIKKTKNNLQKNVIFTYMFSVKKIVQLTYLLQLHVFSIYNWIKKYMSDVDMCL